MSEVEELLRLADGGEKAGHALRKLVGQVSKLFDALGASNFDEAHKIIVDLDDTERHETNSKRLNASLSKIFNALDANGINGALNKIYDLKLFVDKYGDIADKYMDAVDRGEKADKEVAELRAERDAAREMNVMLIEERDEATKRIIALGAELSATRTAATDAIKARDRHKRELEDLEKHLHVLDAHYTSDVYKAVIGALELGKSNRRDGYVSPYKGDTLAHSLHASGWVAESLRLALIKTDPKYAKSQADGDAVASTGQAMDAQ